MRRLADSPVTADTACVAAGSRRWRQPMPPPAPPIAPAAATAPPPAAERVEESLRCRRSRRSGGRDRRIARSTISIAIRRSGRSSFRSTAPSSTTTGAPVVTANAEVLKKYATWVITIEGHCDERGTAEYNLALGERRAVAVRTYLVSLGIAPDRIRTVSYGKEFPFDPGHDGAAWAKNRRAHFVITSK